jgi:hypothetical protein
MQIKNDDVTVNVGFFLKVWQNKQQNVIKQLKNKPSSKIKMKNEKMKRFTFFPLCF